MINSDNNPADDTQEKRYPKKLTHDVCLETYKANPEFKAKYEAVNDALNCIKLADFTELKSLKNPP